MVMAFTDKMQELERQLWLQLVEPVLCTGAFVCPLDVPAS